MNNLAMRVGSSGSPQINTANRLLEALCRERKKLRDLVTTMDCAVGHEFCAQGAVVDYVYFPAGGVLSLSLYLRSGQGSESSTVGSEGFVGLPVYLGLVTSPYRVVQQSPGRVLRLSAKEFCSQIEGSRNASQVLKRFTAYCLQFGQQNGVCNLYHSVQQRACRWLLTTADRTEHTPLHLTQSTLAEMLGVRRQSVGEIAVALQRDGLVSYTRGLVTIGDRAGLEAASCECYGAMRRYYDETIGMVS